MKNTTEEILARIGNVAGEMAGSLSTRNRSMFAADHIAVIDADLAELRERFATVYAALGTAESWLDFLRMSCDGKPVLDALKKIRAARATESGEVTRG